MILSIRLSAKSPKSASNQNALYISAFAVIVPKSFSTKVAYPIADANKQLFHENSL